MKLYKEESPAVLKEFYVHSNANTVYADIKSRANKRKIFGFDELYEIEPILLKKKEPLINLAIAQYGTNPEVVEALFKEGNKAIRLAALSNPIALRGGFSPGFSPTHESWISTEIVKELLKTGTSEEIAALFSNPHLDSDFLVELYEKKGVFELVEDNKWQAMVAATIGNERLRTPYDDSRLDGYADYRWNEVFDALWNLSLKVPVTEVWAGILSGLYGGAVTNDVYGINIDIDIPKALQMWRVENEQELSNWQFCRTAIASLYPAYSEEFDSLKDSDDPSLRYSYYERFDPDSPEELDPLFKKDGKEFLIWATGNPKLYRRYDIRSKLSGLCWKHEGLFFVNQFNSMCDQYENQHPEWFDEESELDKSSNIEEVTLNDLNEKLEALYTGISNLKLTIAEDYRYTGFKIGIGFVVLVIIILLNKYFFD